MAVEIGCGFRRSVVGVEANLDRRAAMMFATGYTMMMAADLAAESFRHLKLPEQQPGHHENASWAAPRQHRALAALYRDHGQRDGDDFVPLVHADVIHPKANLPFPG